MEFLIQEQTRNATLENDIKRFSDSVYLTYFTDVIISALLMFVVSLFGVVVNVISLVVFLQQRLRDYVSVALISLCVSDLGMTLLSLGTSLCYAWKLVRPGDSPSNDALLYAAFLWPYSMLYDISALTTALISAERFLCVAMPLKVKHVVTIPRMLTAVAFVYVYNVAVYCPLFKAQELRWSMTSSVSNSSSLVVWLSQDHQIFENVVFYINVLGLIVIAQTVVTICSVGMVSGLIMSKNFQIKSLKRGKKMSRLKKQEVVLIKTVFMIAIMFCISNSLLVAFTFAIMFYPEFRIDGAYSGAYLLCSAIVRLCSVLNATGNGCIYFKLSSKFRHVFQRWFVCRKH